MCRVFSSHDCVLSLVQMHSCGCYIDIHLWQIHFLPYRLWQVGQLQINSKQSTHAVLLFLSLDNSTLIASGGKAAGVRLRPASSRKCSTVIKARKGVISNASVWDTQTLLPNQDITPKQEQWSAEAKQTPQTGSFMHLHLGQSYVFFSCCSCSPSFCFFFPYSSL